MFDMSKVCEYVCDRYYHVTYDRDAIGREKFAQGLLLNYYDGNIVLLSEKGIYHIKYNDIIFMEPIEPRMDKLSEDFKELLESFRKDNIS